MTDFFTPEMNSTSTDIDVDDLRDKFPNALEDITMEDLQFDKDLVAK